ncbi:MAG: hypothetical protein WC501_02250 [Candidatus Micrarchaeia archaeon]
MVAMIKISNDLRDKEFRVYKNMPLSEALCSNDARLLRVIEMLTALKMKGHQECLTESPVRTSMIFAHNNRKKLFGNEIEYPGTDGITYIFKVPKKYQNIKNGIFLTEEYMIERKDNRLIISPNENEVDLILPIPIEGWCEINPNAPIKIVNSPGNNSLYFGGINSNILIGAAVIDVTGDNCNIYMDIDPGSTSIPPNRMISTIFL